MYCSDYDYNALDPVHVGLGQVRRATAYLAPGARSGPAHPCDDLRFRMMNPRCADLNGGAPAPAPPPRPAPPKTKPVAIVDPVDMPMPILKLDPGPAIAPPPTPSQPPKPEQMWTPGPDPIVETVEQLLGPQDQPALEPTILSVGGGGWGGAPAPTATDVSLEAGDVYLETGEPEEKGFGLVEAALGAALAWVLSSAYRRRR